MSKASAYQDTAPVKAQEIEANDQASKTIPPKLHASALAKAVSHLNRQTERGDHAPHYDPAESSAT